jgi:hypothetical protein
MHKELGSADVFIPVFVQTRMDDRERPSSSTFELVRERRALIDQRAVREQQRVLCVPDGDATRFQDPRAHAIDADVGRAVEQFRPVRGPLFNRQVGDEPLGRFACA